MKRREEILRDLETMQDLPSLPRVITRLQQEINKPEHDIETIARIIAEDPPIALKVLKVVNSPMYRALRKVVSIHEAALRLGLKEISEILLATPLSDLRKNQHGVDFSRFWNHSISVAHAARAITSISSSRMNAVTKHMGEAVFTAALLHDIGMLMLNKYSPEVYDNINEAPENNLQPPISVIEKKVLGISHAEAGAFVLRKWHLPEEIVLGVESHHTLKTRAAATPVAQIIHVADYICVQEGAGGGFETASMILHESAWDEIGISRADIPLIIESVRKHLQESPLLVA